jgi:predicted enzyme related to lactoylglutathione lyase
MGKPVAFFEIISPDAPRAQRFYAELFDWRVDTDPSMGGFGLVDTGAGEAAIPGGIGASTPDDIGGTRVYMRVDDLDAYLDKAESLGGKRLLAPTDLPNGYGKIAVLADPDGNPVGLWA